MNKVKEEFRKEFEFFVCVTEDGQIAAAWQSMSGAEYECTHSLYGPLHIETRTGNFADFLDCSMASLSWANVPIPNETLKRMKEMSAAIRA